MKSEDIRYINVSVANMYSEPSYRSEICSQAVLWERVLATEERKGFIRITSEDRYDGWIDERQLTTVDDAEPADIRMVTAMQASIEMRFDDDASTLSLVPAGGYLDVVSSEAEEIHVIFPDGRLGWLKNDEAFTSHWRDRETIAVVAKLFLGVPYFWGGKTSYGLDCSGYVQLVHKLCGISIPRDSVEQHDQGMRLSTDHRDARAGDLLFFSETGKRISHVGMSLGDGLILHSRGMVTLNSLCPEHPHFRPALRDTFVEVKSYIDDRSSLEAP
jgi:gamma-D-glutamyl-L-lysine dipeptidyl-peptidase